MRRSGYIRVSSEQQGRSGLGIEAQRGRRRAVRGRGLRAVAEYVEVETGKGCRRARPPPAARRRADAGRRPRCPVIVAKLDRLSRDVAFIAA